MLVARSRVGIITIFFTSINAKLWRLIHEYNFVALKKKLIKNTNIRVQVVFKNNDVFTTFTV